MQNRIDFRRILPLAVLFSTLEAFAQSETAVLQDSFDEPESFQAWKPMQGAGTGEEPVSQAEYDKGSILLSGACDTRSWTALTRTVALPKTPWIRISVRMKTENVQPEGARWVNSNLFLRFGQGPLIALPILTGDNEWKTVARRFPVPSGTDSVTLGLFLSMPGKTWFDDVRLEAVPSWELIPMGHFVYRVRPGEDVSRKAHTYNEQSYTRMVAFFGKPYLKEVSYVRYPDVERLEEYTGRRGNAHIQDGAIHTIWPTDRHEIAHLFALHWGDPPALVAEGLAVHLSGTWKNQPVRKSALAALKSKTWPGLEAVLDSREFRLLPDAVTYPISGAFAEWLLDSLGHEDFRILYSTMKNQQPAAQNKALLEEALGKTLKEADAEFQVWLTQPKG